MGIFYFLVAVYFLGAFAFSFVQASPKKRMCETLYYGFFAWGVLAARSPQNGVDLIGYCPQFERIADFTLEESFTKAVQNYEQGYTVFNKLVSLFSSDIHFFLAVTAAVTIILIGSTIYRYSSNIFLSFLIFVSFGLYIMCFSGLRQSLAFSITFFSLRFLVDKKHIKFFITVFIASTFHTSALIFALVWFLRNKQLPIQLSLTITVVYAVAILPFVSSLLPIFTSLLFDDKYGSYEHHLFKMGTAYTMMIVYAIVLFGSYIFTKDDKRPIINMYRWIILFAVLFQSLGLFDAGALTRIGYYFSLFFALFIPEAISYIKPFSRQYTYVIASVLFAIFFLITISSGTYNIVPYHFFWEQGWGRPLPFPL